MTTRRARWMQNGEASWQLKVGSMVKALITYDRGYRWTTYTVPIIVGSELTLGAAKRAARKALREAGE